MEAELGGLRWKPVIKVPPTISRHSCVLSTLITISPSRSAWLSLCRPYSLEDNHFVSFQLQGTYEKFYLRRISEKTFREKVYLENNTSARPVNCKQNEKVWIPDNIYLFICRSSVRYTKVVQDLGIF